MAGVFFLQLIINAFLFSFLFWGLTFVAKSTYSNKFYMTKLNFYECGFKNFTIKKIKYELNFILVLLFLLIYDGEFLVLIPVSLNPNILTVEICFLIVFFMFWLLISLFYDYAYYALEWQI